MAEEREVSTTEMLNAIGQIKLIAYQSVSVDVEVIQAIQKEIERTETLGPILDPTWYRRSMNNIDQHRDLVAAFSKFRNSLKDFEDALKNA